MVVTRRHDKVTELVRAFPWIVYRSPELVRARRAAAPVSCLIRQALLLMEKAKCTSEGCRALLGVTFEEIG